MCTYLYALLCISDIMTIENMITSDIGYVFLSCWFVCLSVCMITCKVNYMDLHETFPLNFAVWRLELTVLFTEYF